MRYIEPFIKKDIEKKMVFLAGPRQVGKTTLSQSLQHQFSISKYFNWDNDEGKNGILKKKWDHTDELLIFDELHKFPRWKNWIKGIYDMEKEKHSFLITGSARLDVYKKGGDSLLGRYFYWRLHPFCLAEIPAGISKEEALDRLIKLGGFPEPFLSGDERFARRWRSARFDRILLEDIRDLEHVRDIGNMRILVELLKERVGACITISHLANDLQVSHITVKHWIEIFEKMYLCFAISPYSKKLTRALQKQKKIFFFDNADVKGDDGAVFENLIATHLLKRLHFLEDGEGYRYELKYLRDKEGREVDFVIEKDGEVHELIEVKISDEKPSKSLQYYAEKLQCSRIIQIVKTCTYSRHEKGVHIMSPFDYFENWKWEYL